MAFMRDVTRARCIMGKLKTGDDLLEALTAIAAEHGITLGRVEALGAVSKARLAYYDQGAREYRFFNLDRPLEITALIGNVSLKDGEPIVHAHLTLADGEGNAYGGHLAPGTVVFACEVVLQAFDGPAFVRGFDEETGLPLWEME